ncbi:protein kinase [Kocuria rhizophila]|nr:protein kinase [Kocuria rhizophila]
MLDGAHRRRRAVPGARVRGRAHPARGHGAQAPRIGPAPRPELLVLVLRGPRGRTAPAWCTATSANVLLTADGQVKVADFGLTRAVDDHATSTTVLGTVGYAAPELVGGAACRPRSDVYAVGIMAYEMFAAPPIRRAPGPAGRHRAREPVVPAERDRQGVSRLRRVRAAGHLPRRVQHRGRRRAAGPRPRRCDAPARSRGSAAPGGGGRRGLRSGFPLSTGHAEEAPTEAVGASTADSSGEEATEAMGPGVRTCPPRAISTLMQEAPEALGAPGTTPRRPSAPGGTSRRGRGRGARRLPEITAPDPARLRGGRHGHGGARQVRSAAHRSPHEPAVCA